MWRQHTGTKELLLSYGDTTLAPRSSRCDVETTHRHQGAPVIQTVGRLVIAVCVAPPEESTQDVQASLLATYYRSPTKDPPPPHHRPRHTTKSVNQSPLPRPHRAHDSPWLLAGSVSAAYRLPSAPPLTPAASASRSRSPTLRCSSLEATRPHPPRQEPSPLAGCSPPRLLPLT